MKVFYFCLSNRKTHAYSFLLWQVEITLGYIGRYMSLGDSHLVKLFFWREKLLKTISSLHPTDSFPWVELCIYTHYTPLGTFIFSRRYFKGVLWCRKYFPPCFLDFTLFFFFFDLQWFYFYTVEFIIFFV